MGSIRDWELGDKDGLRDVEAEGNAEKGGSGMGKSQTKKPGKLNTKRRAGKQGDRMKGKGKGGRGEGNRLNERAAGYVHPKVRQKHRTADSLIRE